MAMTSAIRVLFACRSNGNRFCLAANQAFARAKAWFAAERKRFPDLFDRQAKSALMAEVIAMARAKTSNGRLNDVWIQWPLPDLAEPGKRLRYVTDFGDYDDAHVANLLMKATLWPVDSVFNRVRRRLTLCERPVTSKRRAGPLWHIYAPYEPAMLIKVLAIFRVWHNFVWISPRSKTTAATHLGLASGKIRLQDILAYK